MNGAEPGKPTCCPRDPKSTTVKLFQVDPCWYERHWWSDPAPRRRSAFGYDIGISVCRRWIAFWMLKCLHKVTVSHGFLRLWPARFQPEALELFVSHSALNQRVAGSSPTAPTNPPAR
jgi:hypothetical protein